MLILAMVPDEMRTTRTGCDLSPIGFDKGILVRSLIPKEITKERDAKNVEVSVGIIYCIGYVICVLDVGVVSQFETYRPTILSPRAIPADCFDVNSLGVHGANEKRAFIADYASRRIVDDEWNTIGFKGHRGRARGRIRACKSIHLMTYIAIMGEILSFKSDQCVLKTKMRQVQHSLG
jgi:hypothetical protein